MLAAGSGTGALPAAGITDIHAGNARYKHKLIYLCRFPTFNEKRAEDGPRGELRS